MNLSRTINKVKSAFRKVKHLDVLKAKSQNKNVMSSSKQSENNKNNSKGTKIDKKHHFNSLRQSGKQQHHANSSLALSRSYSIKTNRESGVVLDVLPQPPKSILKAHDAPVVKKSVQFLDQVENIGHELPKSLRATKPAQVAEESKASSVNKSQISSLKKSSLKSLTSTAKKSIQFSETTEMFSHHENYRPVNIKAARITRLAHKISQLLDTIEEMDEYTDPLAYRVHFLEKEVETNKVEMEKKSHVCNVLFKPELESPDGNYDGECPKEMIEAKKRKAGQFFASRKYDSSVALLKSERSCLQNLHPEYYTEHRKDVKCWKKTLRAGLEKKVRVLQKRLVSVIFEEISNNPYAYVDLPHFQPSDFGDVLPQYLVSTLIKGTAKIYNKSGEIGAEKYIVGNGATTDVHQTLTNWTQFIRRDINVSEAVKFHPSEMDVTIATTNGISPLLDHENYVRLNGRHMDDCLQLCRNYMSRKSMDYNDSFDWNQLTASLESQLISCEKQYCLNPCYETEIARCRKKWDLRYIHGTKAWMDSCQSLDRYSAFTQLLSQQKLHEVNGIESKWI